MTKFQNIFCHRFSGSKLPQKMVLAVFTRCLVPEIRIFCHFWLKSAFLGPHFSRTKICTAKPMILGYKGHFLRQKKKKLKKSLEPFFVKSKKMQKIAKNGKKLRFQQNQQFLQKKGHATFKLLWMPKKKLLRVMLKLTQN